MYYDKCYPFYAIYANPWLYRGEKIQEDEFLRMKSYFPETARKLQERIEEKCDELDYEGSRLYDEHPDKFMLYHFSQEIRREMEAELRKDREGEALPEGYLDDLTQVMLYQEILRRRCRKKRYRGWL